MAGASFSPGNTLMMNSVVGDDWIRRACSDNPTKKMEDGYIKSGPIRLAFCDTLYEPKAPSNNPNGTPKYSVCALYTPYTDLNVFYTEYYRICGEMFREFYNPHMNQYSGLENPFHDCATKAHKFEGFTPGLTYINHTSKFQPAIVDTMKNPITDRSKVFPGAWAILICNAYGYGKSPPQPKKGVSFGLQAVMIIGQDTNLSGGGVDPRQAFAGVNVQPPAINPAMFQGLVPPPPNGAGAGAPGRPPAMPGVIPGAPTTYSPPPPPNPLYGGLGGTVAADDPFDISSLR